MRGADLSQMTEMSKRAIESSANLV